MKLAFFLLLLYHPPSFALDLYDIAGLYKSVGLKIGDTLNAKAPCKKGDKQGKTEQHDINGSTYISYECTPHDSESPLAFYRISAVNKKIDGIDIMGKYLTERTSYAEANKRLAEQSTRSSDDDTGSKYRGKVGSANFLYYLQHKEGDSSATFGGLTLYGCLGVMKETSACIQ